MAYRQKTGRWGEQVAADFLEAKGYTILERNARSVYGELDLVARQGAMLVFIEVKTRTSQKFGWPEDAVTPAKQAHLLAAAQSYLLEHPEYDSDWRIDVIAIEGRPGKSTPKILHYENAIN